ncbi:MAG TPA: zf-HC2 domain-containing protein [Gemmatimonadaceae bacterium]|jgi:anti-sigma factor RsiW|nr:zf-HC2 domain-containing protein [Gemmatimonadaceae bacterium]
MTTPRAANTQHVPTPIDCETAVRRLWDYLDNQLSPASFAEVESHLATCMLCAPHFVFAQSMKRVLAESQSRRNTADPIGGEDRLRDRVRRALWAERWNIPESDGDGGRDT